MASVYRQAFATPGANRFVPAAFVGRLPISMVAIGIVLYIQHTTGSYGVGGTVVAAGTISEAALAAQLGRALDRFGQARVLLWCLAGHLVGLVGLLVSVGTGAPRPLWYIAGALTGGLFPPVGACVRARWSYRLGGSPLLSTAFALEAALDEAIFICGPVLVTWLVTEVTPASGLVVAGGLLAAGTLALAAQRGSDPGPRPKALGAARPRVFRDPAVRALLVVIFSVGVCFGGVDLAAVAYGREGGLGALSGLVLGLFAFGSGVSSLLYGARASTGGPTRRFLTAAALMAAAAWLPLAAPNTAVLLPFMVIAGAGASPTLISANALMERLMPPEARTEGFAWLQVALVTGISAGTPLAGALIDRYGPRAGFTVVAGAGVLVGLAALSARRALLAVQSAEPTAAAEQAADAPAALAGPAEAGAEAGPPATEAATADRP
ncbi:MFS transporter [Pseudofrankia sp. BMG5.36]|uniref:MFS transporter n=1 Tax=Pseudofrankia sp. BMG5.36 TaxID=1834512 RepID=UPI0008DA6907|nr:MFS transporter [Pseudofrankia sp. BMG5.36]OHV45611.1 ABC transporter permease [Pseudofrankia sp. BMG5.36]